MLVLGYYIMSFHWNLSSDEEEESHEWQSKWDITSGEDTKPPARSSVPVVDKTTTENVAETYLVDTGGFEFSEEEEEDVDWEDADDDDDDALPDTKLAATPTLVPVTINMNQPAQSPEKKQKKRTTRRRVYRFHSLPPDLQSLLLHIQQSHLLTLTSRAVQLSRCCSERELLHVAHSLVPLADWPLDTPTEAQVRDFMSWYFDLVNRTEERRRRTYAANVAAGAPTSKRGVRRSKSAKRSPINGLGVTKPDRLFRVSSYLSHTNDDHPQLIESDDEIELNNQDKTQLLISMVRYVST